MNILYASETSNWLKNTILCKNNQFECRVRMIFNHSVVLQTFDQTLIHITGIENNLSPFSLLVNGFVSSDISENEKVKYFNNSLVFSKLLIDVKDSIKLFDESRSNPTIKLSFTPKTGLEFSKIFLENFLKTKKSLIAALEARNARLILENSLKILGMGDGLTPAGDDYFLGLIYGLYNTFESGIIDNLRAELFPNIAQKTTLISKEFLIHALNARFSKNIAYHNWDTLLQYGHNSGYFVLWGIYDSINIRKKALVQLRGT